MIDAADEGTSIMIPRGHYTITRTLDIEKSIDLVGSEEVIFDGIDRTQILRITNPDSDVSISNIDFVDGVGDRCGAIETQAKELVISNCKFSQNHGSQAGAICNHVGGGLEVRDECKFSQNEGKAGGAICNEGTLVLRNSAFEGNRADIGGAITNSEMSSTVLDGSVRFIGNTATNGGAVYNARNCRMRVLGHAVFNGEPVGG
jgi:predicted outer membrane repeat protein